MLDKNISLASVIQVMLFRRILPCQRRTRYLWEFDPAGPRTLQRFFGTKHEDMWNLLFKTQKTRPKMTDDLGLDCTHASSLVTFSMILFCKSRENTKLSILQQGWTKKAERIHYPDLLPEDPAIPLLMRMLVPALYQASEEGQEEGKGG